MEIGILSDSHDHMDRIREAVRILRERGIQHVIHGGDFVAPFALIPFVEANFAFYSVFGNNDGELRGLRLRAEPIGGIQAAPYRFELAGKRFLLHHYPQADERLRTERGKSDYFIYGHTHVAEKRSIGSLTVLNPGELCGWLEGNATFMILDTDSQECEMIELP